MTAADDAVGRTIAVAVVDAVAAARASIRRVAVPGPVAGTSADAVAEIVAAGVDAPADTLLDVVVDTRGDDAAGPATRMDVAPAFPATTNQGAGRVTTPAMTATTAVRPTTLLTGRLRGPRRWTACAGAGRTRR